MNNPMKDPLKDYVKNEDKTLFMRIADIFRGKVMTEYALLIAVIAIIVTAFGTWVGFHLFDLFSGINDNMSEVNQGVNIEIESVTETEQDVTDEKD